MKLIKFLTNRFRAFGYAWAGLILFFKQEQSAKIHAVLGIGVILAGIFYKISITEWLVVILTIGLVIGIEILNTAIEEMVDLVHPHRGPQAGKIKDLAAGAVFFSSIVAICVASIIFIPKIFHIPGMF